MTFITGDRDLNELNIPHHDQRQQAHVLRTVNLAGNHVEELAGALEAFHSRVRNRLLIIHVPLSPLNSKVKTISIYFIQNYIDSYVFVITFYNVSLSLVFRASSR